MEEIELVFEAGVAAKETVLSHVISTLTGQLKAKEATIQQWKANHDDMVKRCALLRERPDLPVDRILAYEELIRLQALVKTHETVLDNVIEPLGRLI